MIKLSKKYEVKVIINPAPAKPFIKKYLKDAFLITPNLQEAKTLLSLDEIKKYHYNPAKLENVIVNYLINL